MKGGRGGEDWGAKEKKLLLSVFKQTHNFTDYDHFVNSGNLVGPRKRPTPFFFNPPFSAFPIISCFLLYFLEGTWETT